MISDGPPPVGGPVASGEGASGEDPGGDAAPRGTAPPSRHLRLLVAYDGTDYHGFAENRGVPVPTVAGDLRRAMERVLRHPVTLTCAGRTDRGVHARGQVVTFDTVSDMEPRRLRDALNGLLGPRIVVREADVVPADLDARFSAESRTYHYLVLNRDVPDPFLAATSWWVPDPMDRAALAEGCIPLIGQHDFTSFCRRPKGLEGPLVRHVRRAEWHEVTDEPGLLQFTISASAFCHQMVRSIVGLLVDVGKGRRTPADVQTAVQARDRSTIGQLAPPRGLTLWEVGYPDPGLPGAEAPGTLTRRPEQ